MKALIIAPLVLTSIFAWDCSDAIADEGVSPKAYCRSISSMITVMEYDRLSIKAGDRISTLSEGERITILSALGVESEQCYQTCVLANTDFY